MPEVGARPHRGRRRPEPVTLNGVSILIVDDETDARELMVAMLENFGATVRRGRLRRGGAASC